MCIPSARGIFLVENFSTNFFFFVVDDFPQPHVVLGA